MILISWPRLCVLRILGTKVGVLESVPLDGLVLDFGYLIFDKCHHLTKDFVLSGLVTEEVVMILFDFVHQVVEAHEPRKKSEHDACGLNGMRVPKVLVWGLHLG